MKTTREIIKEEVQRRIDFHRDSRTPVHVDRDAITAEVTEMVFCEELDLLRLAHVKLAEQLTQVRSPANVPRMNLAGLDRKTRLRLLTSAFRQEIETLHAEGEHSELKGLIHSEVLAQLLDSVIALESQLSV